MSMNYRSAKKRGKAKDGRECCTLGAAMGQSASKKFPSAPKTMRYRMDQGSDARPYKPTNKIGTSMGQ